MAPRATFEVLTPKKGLCIDGHECSDAVESRKGFLRKMVKIGFIHFTNAPTEDAVKAIPQDVDPPTLEECSKTVVFFHDESTFQANNDQILHWGQRDEKIMKPKSKGAGIMISVSLTHITTFLPLQMKSIYVLSKTIQQSRGLHVLT